MKYFIYIDNVARYKFFKKLFLSKDKKINSTFVVDLISSYFYLKSAHIDQVYFFTSNAWEIFFCRVFKVKYFNFNDFSIENPNQFKFVFWNGKHRKQKLFCERLNKDYPRIFIENANINNLFQYGFKGIGASHENIQGFERNLESKSISDFEIIKLLHSSKQSQLRGLGREKYHRNIIEILLDCLFSPVLIFKTLKNFLYSQTNKFTKQILIMIK